MNITNKAKYLVIVGLLILLLVGIVGYYFLSNIYKINQNNATSDKTVQKDSSVFEKIVDKNEINLRTIDSYIKQNDLLVSFRLAGLTALPDFTDTPSWWKSVLLENQYAARVTCKDEFATTCDLDFFTSYDNENYSRKFSDVVLSSVCLRKNTEFLESEAVYTHLDEQSLASYDGKKITLIAYSSSDFYYEEFLPILDWCIYYVK